MSTITHDISEAVQRLRRHDPKLKTVDLFHQQLMDSEVAELVDCLLAHSNVVTHMYLASNRLTDVTGIKVAQYVASSSTIRMLLLYENQFGPATYLALAAALCINTSLRGLSIYDDQVMNENCINRIDAAFIDALILNPNRPADSSWWLYSWSWYNLHEFERLKAIAGQWGHPSMQALLAMRLFS